jgi:predicted DNA-binding transcriptional regulator AlpA
MTENRLIRVKEVLTYVGMNKTKWYAGVRSGEYPQPIRRGKRDVVWSLNEIQAYINREISQARGEA